MKGAVHLYRERQRGWIQRKEYREEMALGLLAGHVQTQHGKEAEGGLCWEAMDPGEEPRTYRMAFLTSGGTWNCTVEGCLGRAATRMTMRVHFFHRHVQDTVIILEEGNLS